MFDTKQGNMINYYKRKGECSMKNISDKQKEIFEYIKNFIEEKGVAPSVREIANSVGLKSASTVQYHLNALEDAGLIERDPLLKRTIRLCSQSTKINRVPLIGTVTAGNPILAFEEIEDYIAYTANVSNDKKLFALKIKGESMINVAILDGDIVIVEQTPVAKNGDIVVALIENEATVKRFYKENGHFRLQPENDLFEPIIVNDLSILGKVIACMRYY